MSLNHSTGIVTDGLQLYYDMSNFKKSWKGKPITNHFTLPTIDVNGFGVQNDTFTRIRFGNYGGYEIQPSDYVWRFNVGSNACPYHGWDIPTTAGDVVIFSFDYYVDASTTNYPITNHLASMENAGSGVGGGYGDPTPSAIGVWKQAYFSSTASATGNSRCLLYPGSCGGRLGDSGFILYKNPQVEFNSPGNIPMPFVAGTRTNTQSIVDLTDKNTLTANNLVYSSDNKFSFDGGASRVLTGLSINNLSTTWEAWIRCTEVVNTYNMFMGSFLPYFSFHEGNKLYFSNVVGGTQQTFQTAANLSLNTWYYATFTTQQQGSNTLASIYLNGELAAQQTQTGLQGAPTSQFTIGDWQEAVSYPFKGSISAVKVYDRALSAAEIRQNFNATRSRYGI